MRINTKQTDKLLVLLASSLVLSLLPATSRKMPRKPTGQNGTPHDTSAAPAVDQTSLSFGDVNVSSISIKNVTVTNTGAASLTISKIDIKGAVFSQSGLAPGNVLRPGQSAIFSAMFAPEASGNAIGNITLVSDATGAVTVITLSGTGV